MTRKWTYALSSADTAPPTAPILLTGSVPDNLRRAGRLGYQGLEVHTREDAALDYGAIEAAMAESGVRIASIVTGRLNTQGMVNLLDDRPYITAAAVQGMLAYVDIAARLHTDLIVGWVKGQVPNEAGRPSYMARLARNLKTICAAAADKGVKVMAEVINRYEVNVFVTAAELMDFIAAYQLDNLYAHLDTFHMNIEETDPAAAIRLCGDKLGYFHLADNTRCYPGTGTLDFAPCLAALEETGYAGWLSVECFPQPDGETAAARALDHLKGLEATR